MRLTLYDDPKCCGHFGLCLSAKYLVAQYLTVDKVTCQSQENALFLLITWKLSPLFLIGPSAVRAVQA